MSPAPSGLALQRVKLGYALKICNGIIFKFYPGLPHLYLLLHKHNLYTIVATSWFDVHRCILKSKREDGSIGHLKHAVYLGDGLIHLG